MIYSDKCPHCEKETVVEQPAGDTGGIDTVEYQQQCDECGGEIVGIFSVEYVLQGVRAG